MSTGQSKLSSVVEMICNALSGQVIAWCVAMTVMPWFGYDVTPGDALGLNLIFTAISILRGYIWRRTFNWLSLTRSKQTS